MHPLTHFSLQGVRTYLIETVMFNINIYLQSIEEQLEDIKTRTIYSSLILQQIQDEIDQFWLKLQYINENYKELKQNDFYDLYKHQMLEYTQKLASSRISLENEPLLIEMIKLVKLHFIYQNQLENDLKLVFRMFTIIKMRGKKVLDNSVRPEIQNRIIQYTNLVLKHDFIQNYLSDLNLNEFISIIDLLFKQEELILQIKHISANNIGFYDDLFFDKDCFIENLNKWKKNLELI